MCQYIGELTPLCLGVELKAQNCQQPPGHSGKLFFLCGGPGDGRVIVNEDTASNLNLVMYPNSSYTHVSGPNPIPLNIDIVCRAQQTDFPLLPCVRPSTQTLQEQRQIKLMPRLEGFGLFTKC